MVNLVNLHTNKIENVVLFTSEGREGGGNVLVGSSGVLLGKGKGKEIDGTKGTVWRMNASVVGGKFVSDVGSRCDVRVIAFNAISECVKMERWLGLGGGGKVIKFSDYHKPKKIKKIDLGEFFDLGRTLSSLSKSERETLNWLLNKSLYPKD